MSEKRNVPTFRVRTSGVDGVLEGPVLAPDKSTVALSITDVHQILEPYHAILIHAGEWVYLPLHSVLEVRRGKNRFDLPWPLTD